MKARDWDYIEARLLQGAGDSTEAIPRLRELGHSDLADRLLEAARTYLDECRAIRAELSESDGRGR